MVALNYRQRLFVEHYLGESEGLPSMPHNGPGIDGLKRWGRDW